MAATTLPSQCGFHTLVGATGPGHIPYSLQSIQGGLRFSDELFTAVNNRCISQLRTHPYSVSLRGKDKKNMLDTIATEIISSLQLPDHVGDSYPGFLHVGVGQLLRKLNETETQRKNREIKRESVGSDFSPVKSQKLYETWTRVQTQKSEFLQIKKQDKESQNSQLPRPLLFLQINAQFLSPTINFISPFSTSNFTQASSITSDLLPYLHESIPFGLSHQHGRNH